MRGRGEEKLEFMVFTIAGANHPLATEISNNITMHNEQ